jgi:hypothetical protein
MPDTPLIQRQGDALRDLVQLSAERAKAESATRSSYTSRTESIEQEFQETQQAIARRFGEESTEEAQEYGATHKAITDRFQSEHPAAEKDYQTTRRAIQVRHDKERAAAKKQRDEVRWEATTVFEAAKDGAKKRYETLTRELAGEMEHFRPIAEGAERLLEEYRSLAPSGDLGVEERAVDPEAVDPLERLREAIRAADDLSSQLGKRFLPRIVQWKNYAWVMVGLSLAFGDRGGRRDRGGGRGGPAVLAVDDGAEAGRDAGTGAPSGARRCRGMASA